MYELAIEALNYCIIKYEKEKANNDKALNDQYDNVIAQLQMAIDLLSERSKDE